MFVTVLVEHARTSISAQPLSTPGFNSKMAQVDPMQKTASRGSERQRVLDDDAQRLAEIGYKQDLRRDWSLLHSFGISFSIIRCAASPRLGMGAVLIGHCSKRHYRYHDVRATIWSRGSKSSSSYGIADRLFEFGLSTGGPGVMSVGALSRRYQKCLNDKSRRLDHRVGDDDARRSRHGRDHLGDPNFRR